MAQVEEAAGGSAPDLIFIAGPNGAGKSTFYETFLKGTGLPFVNADQLAAKMAISNGDAARAADSLRAEFLRQRIPFITETVFPDPVGAKLQFLKDAVASGYRIRLIYIGLSGAALSEARVATRVASGGHDVPPERLARRYKQSLKNLRAALSFIPDIHIFDNSSTTDPYRCVYRRSSLASVWTAPSRPAWLRKTLGKA